MTINESQGQSFYHVGIDLTQNVLESNVCSFLKVLSVKNLKIHVGSRKRLRGGVFAQCLGINIVYEQVIQKGVIEIVFLI